MADLDGLMNLPGAIAAFTFADSGELQEYKVLDNTGVDQNTLDMLCHVCVANLSIATMQARGWEALTGMGGFYPVGGFTLIGMDWSAVVQSGAGVVLDNARADYDAAYAALS